MDHNLIQSKLEAYFDRELPAGEAQEVRHHLKSCTSCEKTILELEQIKAAFSKISNIKASPNFAYQIMEKIQARPVFEWREVLRWAFPTFSLMLVALLFVSLLPMNESIADEAAAVSPFSIQQPLQDMDQDWMGLEAL
jgi:anti-sigma factor RsiW